MNLINKLFLFLFLFLIACSNIPYNISDKYQDEYLNKSHNVDELLTHYEKLSNYLSIKLIIKQRYLKKSNITLRRSILLRSDFYKLDKEVSVQILCHEFVHVWQWRREKFFLFKYLFNPKYRFYAEIDAYRGSIKCWKSLGIEKKETYRFMLVLNNRMSKAYALGSLSKKKYLKLGLEILKREIEK